MSRDKIRAVVFDLGNTLWFSGFELSKEDADAIATELLQPWLLRSGLTLSEPIARIIRDVWEAYEEHWRVELERATFRDPAPAFFVRGAFGVRGIELSEELAATFWRESWIGVRRFGVELYPDTLDVLKAVKERGLLVGINSNRPCTTAMMMDDLADIGIAPYVDAGVASGEVGFFKPHRATFDRVLADLGVAPDEAVMVGDGAEFDMRGAKAAGMRTVWKLNGRYGEQPCADADYEIHELRELLSLPLFGAPVAASAESPTPHEDRNEERY